MDTLEPQRRSRRDGASSFRITADRLEMAAGLTLHSRLGCQAVVTGDVTQIDLPRETASGLIETQHILRGVRGIAFTHFTSDDVVRHPLVARIVEAYERAEKLEPPAARGRRR